MRGYFLDAEGARSPPGQLRELEGAPSEVRGSTDEASAWETDDQGSSLIGQERLPARCLSSIECGNASVVQRPCRLVPRGRAFFVPR